ncbi:hypothetical protein DFH09DRAFT_1089749 [Mycena vulgaris]|nr:hypothetical protein DFH09DRAFT_1089749 [Mycena vulgaris]
MPTIRYRVDERLETSYTGFADQKFQSRYTPSDPDLNRTGTQTRTIRYRVGADLEDPLMSLQTEIEAKKFNFKIVRSEQRSEGGNVQVGYWALYLWINNRAPSVIRFSSPGVSGWVFDPPDPPAPENANAKRELCLRRRDSRLDGGFGPETIQTPGQEILYTYAIPVDALVARSNNITISVASSSSGGTFSYVATILSGVGPLADVLDCVQVAELLFDMLWLF